MLEAILFWGFPCICECVCPEKVFSSIFHKLLSGISPNLQLGVCVSTVINWLDFKVKRFKVKITTRPNMLKIQFWIILSHITIHY